MRTRPMIHALACAALNRLVAPLQTLHGLLSALRRVDVCSWEHSSTTKRRRLQSKPTFDILEIEMVNVRSIHAIFFAVVLLFCLTVSGCSVFSAIGGWFSQGYENTISYFNAYYNAKRLFDEAEADVLAARSASRTRSLATSPSTTFPSGAFPSTAFPPTANPTAQIGSTTKQKFAVVIDKCSNILSFYPKSSVVDDALFLIGKSYFYQEDYLKAERKFTELLSQASTGPLAFDAQLWLLKTLQRLNRLEDAIRVGEELANTATNAGKNEIAGEALTILGDIAVAQNKTNIAIEQYSKSVVTLDDGGMQAAAQSKIGDLYFSLQEYEKAATAYLDVQKYSPDALGLYSSQLQAAIAYRKIQRYQLALDLLQKLKSDYRFMDYMSTIRFELGTTLAESGKPDEAAKEYRLVDTTYAKTEQGAKAAFELGKLFQFQFGNYPDAKTAYTRATQGGPLELTQEARRRASGLDRYFVLQQQFFLLDSVLFILDIDSLWVKKDSSAPLLGKKDTAIALRDTSRLGARQDTSRFGDSRDTTKVRRDTTLTSAFSDTSRSRSTISLRYSLKPKKDTLIASLGNLSYQLGELFYSDLDAPDSTFYWLSQALKLSLDSVKAPRALFVLAEVARMSSDKKYGDEKDLYRKIAEQYPKSTYAEQARIALGFRPTPKKEDPAAPVFVVAESLMASGRYQQALDSLDRIVQNFPESPLVAKSRYTMAWIYENYMSKPDSALSQYRTLAAKFATTAYGQAAQRRIPPPPVAAPDSSKKMPPIDVKKAAPDSSLKAQAGAVTKAPADSSAGGVLVPPTKPDTSKKILDLDEMEKANAVERDSLRSRRARKPVSKE